MKQSLTLSLFLSVLIIFTMCAPSHQVMKPREIKSLSVEDLYDSLTINDGNFDQFIGKFTASYKTETTSHSFKGQVRIKRDSVIWMSISPGLGVELLRVVLKPDSVFFMNRINKEYYKGSYSVIKKAVNVDFNFTAIQSVLLNEFILYPFNVTDTVAFLNAMDISRHQKSIKLQSHKDKEVKKELKKSTNPNLIYLKYVLDAASKKMAEIDLRDYKYSRNLKLSYSNYDTTKAFLVPEDLIMNFSEGESYVNYNMHYSKIQFDKKVSCPFNIPSKYKSVTF